MESPFKFTQVHQVQPKFSDSKFRTLFMTPGCFLAFTSFYCLSIQRGELDLTKAVDKNLHGFRER